MPRNIIEDVVPPQRSIRNIPIPSGRRSKRSGGPRVEPTINEPAPEEPLKTNDENMTPPPAFKNPYERRRNGMPRKFIWLMGIVALVLVFIALASFWNGATVTVTPKKQILSVSDVLSAGSGENLISYTTVEVSAELGEEVPASGEEHVELKASGTIVVYNNYDSNEQRLIKNTRFETTEGLIYRVDESVVVPGQTTKDGKKVPGSVEVVVFADEAGTKYNIGLTDFTIPGFKGDPRFDAFYARSKTEMTGGFSGNRRKVSDSDRDTAIASIRNKLDEQLLSQVATEVGPDSVLFEGAMKIRYEALPQTNDTGASVVLNEKATLYGAVFKKTDLGKAIANRKINPAPSGEISLGEESALTFEPIATDSFNPSQNQTFDFRLSGQAQLVWVFDAESLKSDLTGKSKGSLSTVLSRYGAIEKAEAIIKPFWKRSFPDDQADIEVITAESSQ